MPSTHNLILTHHTSDDAAKLMDELREVYVDAYGARGAQCAGRGTSAGFGTGGCSQRWR